MDVPKPPETDEKSANCDNTSLQGAWRALACGAPELYS